MKIVIPGGTGQLGKILRDDFLRSGDDVTILTRNPQCSGEIWWDGKNAGPWAQAIDGADVVINLAGRTVNCRYTSKNLTQMMNSRIDSTRIVGEAIALAKKPPRLWLQMSTATIYAHRFDKANDELTGMIGGHETAVPGYWGFSVEIAKAWEKTQVETRSPQTRQVAMRTAMVMAPGKGGVFNVLYALARCGFGGSIGSGQQFVSWIHYEDFVAALRFVIKNDKLSGAINFTSPQPLPQRDFMHELRLAMRMPIGLPATKWMAEIGAFVLRTDTELLLKSRRVVPTRLLEAGFKFHFPHWQQAALDLVARIKKS